MEESGNLHEASLDHVDLTVQDGEFVLLTGPSGCGKTTILRLINGLIPHFYPGVTEGSITVNGRSVQERELYETALQVGSVFQNPRSQFYNVIPPARWPSAVKTAACRRKRSMHASMIR